MEDAVVSILGFSSLLFVLVFVSVVVVVVVVLSWKSPHLILRCEPLTSNNSRKTGTEDAERIEGNDEDKDDGVVEVADGEGFPLS